MIPYYMYMFLYDKDGLFATMYACWLLCFSPFLDVISSSAFLRSHRLMFGDIIAAPARGDIWGML